MGHDEGHSEVADAGNDRLEGDEGPDTLSGGIDRDNLAGGDDGDRLNGGADGDDLAGGAGDDTLRGAGEGSLGADGADVLRGEDGNDEMDGDGADDILVGGGGGDDLRGGAGEGDTVSFEIAGGDVSVTLDGRADDGERGESDNVRADVEDVEGGGVEDTFTGSGDDNRLDAGAGQDYVDGGEGDDTLRGGTSADVVRARDGGGGDVVDCGSGSGSDFAVIDPGDTVRRCEESDLPGARPALGRRVNVNPTRGAVEFAPRGLNRTVPLEDEVDVPVSSLVDATGAEVRVTARGRGGRTARGNFSGTDFRLRQERRNGVTDLQIPRLSRRTCAPAASSRAGARQARRRVKRLFTRGRGRFRTRGRGGSATVRGTVFTTEERCNGTLFIVREGTVAVRDFDLGRTVLVRAGRRYFARDRDVRR